MAKKNTVAPESDNDNPGIPSHPTPEATEKAVKAHKFIHLVLPEDYSSKLKAASEAGDISLDELKAHLVSTVVAQDPMAIANAVFEAAYLARKAKLAASMVPAGTVINPLPTSEVDPEDVP